MGRGGWHGRGYGGGVRARETRGRCSWARSHGSQNLRGIFGAQKRKDSKGLMGRGARIPLRTFKRHAPGLQAVSVGGGTRARETAADVPGHLATAIRA